MCHLEQVKGAIATLTLSLKRRLGFDNKIPLTGRLAALKLTKFLSNMQPVKGNSLL